MSLSAPARMSLPFEVLFVGVLCSAQLLTQAGLALSVAPMHVIGNSFGTTNPGQISWFSAGYSLTVGTFILIAGRLGDTFGHKKFFVAGFAWYGLWCVIGGLAVYSDQIMFDISRAMQGIGPAFLLPNTLAIIGRTYTESPRRQEMVFSIFGATAPGGFVLGAVFSSLLSQFVGWQWAYWIMAITCSILAIMGIFVLPPTPIDEEEKLRTRVPLWKRLDVIGSIIGVSSLVLINFAFNQGASVGWNLPYIGVTLGLGLLLFGLFVFVELRSSHPLVPFHVLGAQSVFSLACIAAGWSSFGIFVLYLWNVLETLRNQTPLLTAAQFSVAAVSGLCAAITTGFIISRLKVSLVMLISMGAFTVGGILFATVPLDQIYWAQTFVGLIILPWGMDISFPAATIVLSRVMPKRHQGLAASLVNTVLNYSISIGLGVAGTVDFYVSRSGATMLESYRAAWYTGVGFAGSGLILALIWSFIDRPKKSKSANEGAA